MAGNALWFSVGAVPCKRKRRVTSSRVHALLEQQLPSRGEACFELKQRFVSGGKLHCQYGCQLSVDEIGLAKEMCFPRVPKEGKKAPASSRYVSRRGSGTASDAQEI